MESILSIFIITIAIGFVLGLVVLFKPSFKSDTNKYLGYTVLVISVIMVKLILPQFGYFNNHKKLNIFYDIEWILLAPVFVFFFFIRTTENKITSYKELKLLYLPFIYSLLINSFHCLEKDFGLFSFKNEAILRLRFNLFMFENKLIYIYNVFLMAWLFFILKGSTSKKTIKWLWKLYIVLSLLILFWIILDFIRGIFPNEVNTYYGEVLLIASSFSIYWISYKVIYRHKLLHEVIEINEKLKIQEHTLHGIKIPVSSNTIFGKFENLFKEEHLYRDPTITREFIAEKLDISAGYLSQIINSNIEGNFSSYINQYRVAEVKKMLCNHTFDRYSIEAIGLEAGFSSKTTFYKVFKKFTGMTPRSYKNKHK